MRFLDTNILVRYLTGDDPQKAQASFELLVRVERGEETVLTTDLVIAETVFVLQSKTYSLSRSRIRELIEPVIEMRGLRLSRKSLYSRVFDLYCQQNMSFLDAYNAAYMESRGITEVYSYDTDFDRIESVVRVEPEV